MSYADVTTGLPLPSWWDGATTVKIWSGGNSAIFDKGDIEFFPYGIGLPANEAADWAAALIPWGSLGSIALDS